MRTTFRQSTFFLGLSLVLIISRTTFAIRSIDKLLEEARTAKTKEIADEKLDQADKLLDKVRSMDDIERDFIRADIKQIRGRIHITWERNLKDTQKKNEAYDLLLSVSDDYEKLVQRCEDKAEQNAKRQRNTRGQKERFRTTEQNAIRARYKWAWAEYYIADASDPAVRQGRFNSALEKFKEFTTDGDPNQVYIARCYNGQAHCLYELKRYDEIITLLDPKNFNPKRIKSKDRNTIRDIYKNTTLWRMKAHQELNEHKMVEYYAGQYFDTLHENAKLDEIELEMLILRVRSLEALAKKDESLRSRIEKLGHLIKPYGVYWRTRLAEELDRIGIKTPYWYLNEANNKLASRNYDQALDYVEQGLKEAKSDEKLSANLMYTRFIALWKQNKRLQAYLAAEEFLKNHPKDDRAVEVCGWGIKSGLEVIKSDTPLETKSFLNFLEYAEENFPTNSEAENIPWYKGYILYQDGQYLASKKVLGAIEPNSPVYRRAQHCLAMACYKQVEAIMETGENKRKDITKLLGETAAALSRFADSNAQNPREQEIQLNRNAVELTIETSRCLLNLDPPEPNMALSLIRRMQKFQNVVHQSEDRWLIQQIKANIMTGNIQSATEHVEDLLKKATNATPLIDTSKLFEQMSKQLIKSGRNTDAESVDKKLAMIYTDLLNNYISKSKNEQMRANEASARLLLARCYQRIHEYHKAIELYEWYMNKEPKNVSSDIIRSVALAYEKVNNYNLALPHWRKLFRGLQRRTNEWIEAGYHLINCNVEIDNFDEARKILEYIKLLCPQSELRQWKPKFKALDEKLSLTSLSTGS